MNLRFEKLSRFLSYILRHHPEKLNLIPDKEGFVDLDELLEAMKKSPYSWATIKDIIYVVEHSDKKRFEIKEGRIRALYGHSIDVRIDGEYKPEGFLYHGTSPQFLKGILAHGLLPKGRKYVHLSPNIDMALEVGRRHHPNPVVLRIDAPKAWKDGIIFYRRGDVILARHIPARYLEVIDL